MESKTCSGFVLLFFSFAIFSVSSDALGRHRRSSAAGLTCDMFHGSWVYDNSYPLYNSSSCPFVEPEFDCQKYGRPDNLYLKFKWKPNACELPRLITSYLLLLVVSSIISYLFLLLELKTASVSSSDIIDSTAVIFC